MGEDQATPGIGGQDRASALEAGIDDGRLTGPLLLPLLLCALVMIIDGYDLSAMPLAVPHIVRQWDLAAGGFGIALSAVLVGLGGGAVLFAPFGDRFGRRPVILVSTVAIGLTTLGTASGTSIWGFTLWRLATGLALGACLPNVTALAAELAPRRRRAAIITIVSCGISIGAIGAGMLVPLLVAAGGWPMIFIASGVVTLAIAALLFVALPESPKLLLARGDMAGLGRVARRLRLGFDPVGLPDGTAPSVSPRRPRLAMLALLERPYRLATFVFAGLYTLNAMALYTLTSWLPTLLPQAGFSLDMAARLSSLVQFGGLAGALALSWFLDRAMTVAAMITLYLLVALALVGFSIVPATLMGWGLLLLVVGCGISGAHLAIMPIGTSFYPPQLLSAAIGFAVAVARIGAIAGPLAGGWMIAAGVTPNVFLLVLVAPVLVLTAGVALIPAARRGNAGRNSNG